MNRTVEPGLEVEPSTSPQVAAQPDTNKYCIGSENFNHPISDQSNHPTFDHPNQSYNQIHVKSQGFVRAVGFLIIIVVLLLAVALSVGLGVGLSAQHRQSSLNNVQNASAENNEALVTITETSNAPISATELGTTTMVTPTTPAQSNQLVTVTPTPNISPTRGCPSTNGSTFTATRQPFPTDASQIHNQSLKFEILCDTTYDEGGPLMDIQLIANVSTLNDCLNFCALYDFRMRQENFPAHACTGVSWGYGNDPHVSPRDICWLKNNVTLASSNKTLEHIGYDSAILLLDA